MLKLGEADLDGFGEPQQLAACAGGKVEGLVRGKAEGRGDLAPEEVYQQVVGVVAAEVGVTGGGEDLEEERLARLSGGRQAEDGDVEGAPAQVIDGDGGGLNVFGLGEAQAVGVESRGCGFAGGRCGRHRGPREAARGPCGLSLGIVEVGGDGDDGAGDGLAQGHGGLLAER